MTWRTEWDLISQQQQYEPRQGNEGSFYALQFLPRQRGEVGDGVKLSWSGSRTAVSSDWLSEGGSQVGATDGCCGLGRKEGLNLNPEFQYCCKTCMCRRGVLAQVKFDTLFGNLKLMLCINDIISLQLCKIIAEFQST